MTYDLSQLADGAKFGAQMFEVEVSVQVQDVFREYCLAFCQALRPVDIARGFQAQPPRPVEPVPLGALISAPPFPHYLRKMLRLLCKIAARRCSS